MQYIKKPIFEPPPLWEVEEYKHRNQTDVKFLYFFGVLLIFFMLLPFIVLLSSPKSIPLSDSDYPEKCPLVCSIPYTNDKSSFEDCNSKIYIFNTTDPILEGEVNPDKECLKDCLKKMDLGIFLGLCSSNITNVTEALKSYKIDGKLKFTKIFFNMIFTSFFLLGAAYLFFILSFFVLFHSMTLRLKPFVYLIAILNIIVSGCIIAYITLFLTFEIKTHFVLENIILVSICVILSFINLYTIFILIVARKYLIVGKLMLKCVLLPIKSIPCLITVNIIAMTITLILLIFGHIFVICYETRGALFISKNTYYYSKSFWIWIAEILQFLFLWWVIFFSTDFFTMVISGSVTNWNEVFEKFWHLTPILACLKVVTKSHLGTLCFGSFIRAFNYHRIGISLCFLYTKINEKSKLYDYSKITIGSSPYILTVLSGMDYKSAVHKCKELINDDEVKTIMDGLKQFFLLFQSLLWCLFMMVSILLLNHVLEREELFYSPLLFTMISSYMMMRHISLFFKAIYKTLLISYVIENDHGEYLKAPNLAPFVINGRFIMMKEKKNQEVPKNLKIKA